MRAGRVPVAALLLVFASAVIQISIAEDIYWEGEEDASNEFLEVKEDDRSLTGHFRRIKRGFFDWFDTSSTTSTTPAPENEESVTDVHVDEELPDDNIDSGSGFQGFGEPELKEKTLRVTFVVMEPYQPAYSNRDSSQFQNLSKSLADAVNKLYQEHQEIHGIQRASLVRIQSRTSDDFSCKVTLDIVTTGYDDTDKITKILRDHIQQRSVLERVTVTDSDFSATVIDPENVDKWYKNENDDSEGRSDDSSPTTEQPENFPPPLPQSPEIEQEFECLPEEFKCDVTRCVPLSQRCDGTPDCYDNSDELNCESKSCGVDDFRCGDGRCIKSDRKCDGIVDCPDGIDEADCKCESNEFQCASKTCIEERKRCDGIPHCPDGSDEEDCTERYTPCPPDAHTCRPGSSIACARRCDGIRECDSGEDEYDCNEIECDHYCDNKCLESSRICDDHKDCSDGSDETSCPSCDEPDDFRCNSRECLNIALRCNSVEDCADGSDELNCNQTIPSSFQCSPDQFECRDGGCIDTVRVCNRQPDCDDYSDEENCRCREDEWSCQSGQCIAYSQWCDTVQDCYDGSDESACQTPAPRLPGFDETTTTTTPPPIYTTQFPTIPNSRGPVPLNLRTHPDEQTIRHAKYASGGDVVFQCRDEGPRRAPVRWVREFGRPLKPGATDRNGRLEMNHVTSADSGVYICQATGYLGTPGSQLKVTLTVGSAPPTERPPGSSCQSHQATCGNGQCISKTLLCDGRKDCSDGTDEDNCISAVTNKCEPNEFRCNNKKCVLKTWVCDSEDDCGDGSDEQDCNMREPGENCLRREFTCASNNQCIPKSYHCDESRDCMDGSDEIGCRLPYITKPPQPSNVLLNPGDTLRLVCEAIGKPIPLITWRLNWGHIPEKCTTTSENGIGELICQNMQPENSGAYSCEAINSKGILFANPDSIVFVNKTDVCPNGYFNSEARSPGECIRCFCFGKAAQCRSADLFTFNMPTPLGQGGTRLVGIKQSYSGQINLDTQSITDQFYYQPLRNGATVTKLVNYNQYDSSPGPSSYPYLTLPETYNGNQLTSYGGHIRYRLSPHSSRPSSGYDDFMPDIIIKGKFQNLVHRRRHDDPRDTDVEVRLTPEYWQKTESNGQLTSATREDVMMALDNVESILLKASVNDAGVNITEFTMESAKHIDEGLGPANLVEECSCPPGYEGLSCQKCASGYVRQSSGVWLGDCVLEEPRSCPPGTYGDPSSGYSCRPCPCPLTNRDNQFARTCSLGRTGNVICDCAPGYIGDNCERCAPGYTGNPMVPGDSCQRRAPSNCDRAGTLRIRGPDDCECKENVQGRFCNECRNNSFHLTSDNRHGCALCFCSGVTEQCTSSNLRRRTETVYYNIPEIVDQVKVYESAPYGSVSSVRYEAHLSNSAQPQLVRGEVVINDIERSSNTFYYSLPVSFAGDKVTSYGGYLNYALRHVPTDSQRNDEADVQLISHNRQTFYYFGNFEATQDGYLNASVQLLEKGWQRSDGNEISREHFLLALADIKVILVKATYSRNTGVASLVSSSIDTADNNGDGELALHVEMCACPKGYLGTSCEDCAPGYTRSSRGLYFKNCERCDCNGNSNKCDPESGLCYECENNTEGSKCENCKQGYERDYNNNCVSRQPHNSCNCDERGVAGPCDAWDRCTCKSNVEGDSCDRCRRGSFGLDQNNPEGCISCYCSGVTNDCYEALGYNWTSIPAPMFEEDYGGFFITDLNAEEVIPQHLVPVASNSELTHTFDNPPQYNDLFWSLPKFSGNRLLSYGGNLAFKLKFETNSGYQDESTRGKDVILIGDENSIFWQNPHTFKSGEILSFHILLREQNWFILNTGLPASRYEFMSVLKSLRRILVRVTIAPNLLSTSIADVYMDTAKRVPGASPAKGIEICQCPEGYTGTSCEACASGYYNDRERCKPCNCNGHNCHVSNFDQVVCECNPPYTGPECTNIDGDSITTAPRPQPSHPTVTVTITNPTIKIENVGGVVNFTCTARSLLTKAPVAVTWTKSNGYLPQGRHQIDENTGVLLITQVQVSDSGTYICQTRDGMSIQRATATLTVSDSNPMTAPTVMIRPTEKEFYEGDRVELECITTGNPTPIVSWQRANGRPLPLSVESAEHYLVINSVQEDDAGEYECIARNAIDVVHRTAVINVRPMPSRPISDRLTISPTDPIVIEGKSTRVICTGTVNIPAGSIDWVRQDGSTFSPNIRSYNGVLYIDVANINDQGVYVCQTASGTAKPVPVLVTVMPLSTSPPSETPKVTVAVDRVTIPSGERGTVECFPSGYPLPQVKWSKYEGDFGPDTSQRDNSLIINRAQPEDEGYYACEAKVNNEPVASVHVYVQIEKRVPPKVEIWPLEEQTATLGSQFQFQCRVREGVPEPDVTWSRSGGRPLTKNTEIKRHDILSFGSVEVNDEGVYICTASNVAGSATANATLKVTSQPEITLTPSRQIYAKPGDNINVYCRAHGYPEPTVSIATLPDIREVVSSRQNVAVLNIPFASERDEGEYVCTATSDGGTITDKFVIYLDRGDGGNFEGSGENEIDPYPDYDRPSNIVAIEGQDSQLSCDVPDEYSVTWNRGDHKPLQPNAYQSGKMLVIRNSTKSDSGRYECLLIEERTGLPHTSAFTSLQVMSPPRITLRPATQTVRPGQTTTVDCIVEGDNITNVFWNPVGMQLTRRVEMRGRTLIFHQIEVEDAGNYECFASNRVANATEIAQVIVSGTPEETSDLVSIDRAPEQYRVGESVQVVCRASSYGVRVNWEKMGTNQYVDQKAYGDGSTLTFSSVAETDAGVYRCIGTDPYGRSSSHTYQLDVIPGSVPPYYPEEEDKIYNVRLGDPITLDCPHNQDAPALISWRRDYSALPEEQTYQPMLYISSAREADAGTYICVVTDGHTTKEHRMVLRVTSAVPRFDGNGWLATPKLEDAYTKFKIEISFKALDNNGLILYNSQERGPNGDYLALFLRNGIPELVLKTGSSPITAIGDRPLSLNEWHTIRLDRTNAKVTMDVDNTNLYTARATEPFETMELNEPLYIGGVHDYSLLPRELTGIKGFIGCVGMLVIGMQEKDIMEETNKKYNVMECDSCNPNRCENNGICQDARNERGFKCLCPAGYAGPTCNFVGEGCREGLCGPGKCTYTAEGYKCSCPISYTGPNCNEPQTIEYPAFTGSAYLAIKAPEAARTFFMSMNVKAMPPVSDGILMYVAESEQGHGGFAAVIVYRGKLQFWYQLREGSPAVILESRQLLRANEWTSVQISRTGATLALRINNKESVYKTLDSSDDLHLKTPLFVGGVDDESVKVSPYIEVRRGFSGCVKDVKVQDGSVDIVSSSIQSANVRECVPYERGDIPEDPPSVCSRCVNGGVCSTPSATACSCPPGYSGTYCESRTSVVGPRGPPERTADPCGLRPCKNGGTCRLDRSSKLNFACDCPLGWSGASCHINLPLLQSVGFIGNGYLELPAHYLRYSEDSSDPTIIAVAIHTTSENGVLVYQNENTGRIGSGDYVLLRVVDGHVEFEWDSGNGYTVVKLEDVLVSDGQRHQIVVTMTRDGEVELTVDDKTKRQSPRGFATIMNADSNIFIGGIPESLNVNNYPGLNGCFEQVEFMGDQRSLQLGNVAVAARNTQPCKEPTYRY